MSDDQNAETPSHSQTWSQEWRPVPASSENPLLHRQRLLTPRFTSSYGFPQGKAADFFFPTTSEYIVQHPRKPPTTQEEDSPNRRLRKMPKSSTLSLSLPSFTSPTTVGNQSPLSPMSPTTPIQPRSQYRMSSSPGQILSQHINTQEIDVPNSAKSSPFITQSPTGIPQSPTSTSLPNFTSSPITTPKHERDASKSFFANYKASKSSSRIESTTTIRQVSQGNLLSLSRTRDTTLYSSPHNSGSSPDLLSSNDFESDDMVGSDVEGTVGNNVVKRPAAGAPAKSDSLLTASNSIAANTRKNKPRFAHLLTRTRSIRVDGGSRTSKPSGSNRLRESGSTTDIDKSLESAGMKTAPLQHEKDRSFRDMMGSTNRNRSADRQYQVDSEEGSVTSSKEHKKETSMFSTSIKDGSGSQFLSNLKTSSSKAADGIGKAGKGFIGKITKSGTSNDKDNITDENYVCSVINLPLVEQTRRTRISKRLEDSKDKTEFWMPALPWRCIDYLNFRGTEVEGLYRIPGSGPRVREWQRRFDTELDINLFDDPDLYDINIVGSMFKAWLRELPDEVFPKVTQARIAERCIGATETPQMLKDELSRLPPFNYYLLFAITCHLSSLRSYVDQNKMDYRNLCICFQPCLKIDGFCFQFLVCDWKNCWQGCWTEKAAIVEEYALLDRTARPPPSAGESTLVSSDATDDDRTLSFSDSNKIPTPTRNTDKPRPPPLALGNSQQNADHSSASDRLQGHNRSKSELPELAPVKPLSPLGI
ncbi:MAG: hypothetical protein M1827_003061 [Pycnora praestabilis]|nr:MAG: hypothetical protein M1827_003061 [Pycnora praestabilis]